MREFTRKVTPLSEIDVEKSIDQIIDVANKGLGSSVAPHRFVMVDISLLLGLYEVYKNAAQQSVQLTGGTLPDFQALFDREVLSGLEADTTPPTSN